MQDWTAGGLRSLEIAINELRVIEADFPASYAAVLLYVAQQEKLKGVLPTITEVSDNLGLSRASGSRIILSMSDRRLGQSRAAEERPAGARQALGLLDRIPDAHDLRVMRVRLTPRGRGLVTRLLKAINQ